MTLDFFIPGGYSHPVELAQIARTADRVGVDGLSIADHLFFPTDPETPYPYSSDGSPPFSLDTSWPDAFVLVGSLGAMTTRLKFLTHVYIPAVRHPLIVGKAAGTAAVLTDDRLLLGIGVGWMKEEFEALGSPFHHRGQVTNEAMAILRELWTTGGLEQYHSEFFDIPELVMLPKPNVPIPLLVGGESEAALERAAALGDGFVSLPHPTHEELLEVIDAMRSRVRDHDRDPEAFHINARCQRGADLDQFLAVAEHGAASVHVPLWPLDETPRGKLDAIERFAEQVIEPFRERMG